MTIAPVYLSITDNAIYHQVVLKIARLDFQEVKCLRMLFAQCSHHVSLSKGAHFMCVGATSSQQKTVQYAKENTYNLNKDAISWWEWLVFQHAVSSSHPCQKTEYREGQRKFTVLSVFLGTRSQETSVFFTVL